MFTLNAPGKINWSLFVLDKRPDGFHNIRSLAHCVDLYDRLSFDHSDSLEIFSDLAIPLGEDLVYRAARALQEYTETKRGARILVHKEIPLGSGLGGGSSDAACTLVGLNRLWRLDLRLGDLSEIGQRLGSDVPLFLHAPLCRMEGRGEEVTSLEGVKPYTLLLAKPSWSVSTGWAYGEIDRKRVSAQDRLLTKNDDSHNTINLLYKALREGDDASLAALCHNDFEDVIVDERGEVNRIKEILRVRGAVISLLTGSGSAVFGLFRDRRDAEEASDSLKPLWTRVVETL